MVESHNVIGDVRGRTALIVDDEVDRASSMMGAVEALQAAGVEEIYATAVHAVLSGPSVERIDRSALKEMVLTDTVRLDPSKRIPKIRQLTVAPLIGEPIPRIHTGTSVGSIYDSP